MSRAYSLDLRKKAINLVKTKLSVTFVASLLGIGRSNLFLWIKREREEGSPAPRKEWRKGHSPAVTDLEAFKSFADKHQGYTATRMAEIWGVSTETMCKWLRRIGYTRKKILTATKSGMKQSVQHIWTK